MTDPRSSIAGGAPLALTTVVGALVGSILGQPTMGVLAGIAVGAALALVLWWRDRARRRG